MRILKMFLLGVLALFLFNYSLAAEPELVSEILVEGKTVHGDILSGKLILSSPQEFQVLTAGAKAGFQAELGPNQGLVVSEDGEYFGITTYSTKATPGLLSAERFELHSANGEKLWEIAQLEVSEFFISRDAKVIVGMSGAEAIPESKVAFYNRDGDMVAATKVRLPQGLSFSSDGAHVLINSAKDGLLLFNETGELKNRFEPCDRFAVLAGGKYVATASEGNLRLYLGGKPTRELQVNALVRDMLFSPEGKNLGVIDKKTLYLFEVETGKLLWQYALEKTELSFISLDLSQEGEITITGLDFDNGSIVSPAERHTKGLVYVFDHSGQLVWQEEIYYKLWGAMFPLVQISEDGTKFSVTTREKIYLYENNQPDK